MKAVLLLATIVALDILLLWPATPAWVAGAVLAGGVALMPRSRKGFSAAVAIGLAIQMLLLGFLAPGSGAWAGPITFGPAGAMRGLEGGVRLAGLLAVNVAVIRHVEPAVLTDALPLPRRAHALLGAVLLAADDVARDARRLWEAQQGYAGLPQRTVGRIRVAANLLPNLMALAARRGAIRQEALTAAGIATRPSFAPVVTVTALAVLGRMPFVGLPNVALTYLLVFLGGLVWGPWAGFAGGLLGMALSDVLLSGLLPTAFVNAPAMGLLGLVGGLLGRRAWLPQSRSGAATAGAVGLLATIGFSIVSDTTTWLIVPEFRADLAAWRAIVVAGLAFNAVPAVLNALLFAWAVGPVGQAFVALRQRRFQ